MTARNFFMYDRARSPKRRSAKWTDKSMAAWHAAWEREDFEEMMRIERRARIAHWLETVGEGIVAIAAIAAMFATMYFIAWASNIE